uniref:Cytochrome P450 monooxygenase bsc11 n=1 Tax=Alternaria brassicicola TaxID=29001 RepID=BSC11_ALTBR|nr:RecName: Full=Cytochrome P450 monooxygenase bsc11; AltName: Full=Brassicicene C biosynthetic gene cluster protein 11; AltName: Full=Cytochrome P450 monooxygenase [Alternaria brassicicola]BAI52804.1 cytochrome P450 [Alternaria brassicicola]
MIFLAPFEFLDPLRHALPLTCTGLIIIFAFYLSRHHSPKPAPNIPIHSYDREEYFRRGYELVQEGQKKHPSCFQLRTATGWKILVPIRFVEELRKNPSLSFARGNDKDAFIEYPGFEAMEAACHDDYFMQEVVRVKLTQTLNLLYSSVIDESAVAMSEVLGEDKIWRTLRIKDDINHIVARVTSRVFLGFPLCRNQKWLDIVVNHTKAVFMAQKRMRQTPPALRPLIHYFLPETKLLRQHLHAARTLISPELAKRRAAVEEALRHGKIPKESANAISWMVEVSQAQGRKIDVAVHVVSLSMTAIQTTSEVMTNCILQLCETPSIVDDLRAEIIFLLKEGGWTKYTLYKMRLLDSFIREVMRHHDFLRVTSWRGCTEDVVLSDGTVLPKGSCIYFDDSKVVDPEHYPDPEKFDPMRSFKKREQPGQEDRHQFVSLQTDHMAFGYGIHACPGRFFANMELKVMLCNFLLKYDVRLVPGEKRPVDILFEVQRMVPPDVRVQIKVRDQEPEVDLYSPISST